MFKFIRSMFGGTVLTGDEKVISILKKQGHITSHEFSEIYPTYYARCNCLGRIKSQGYSTRIENKHVTANKRFSGKITIYHLI